MPRRASGGDLPDIVRDWKLDTEIHGSRTAHTHYISNPAERQRHVKVVEEWKQKKLLGRGSFGTVWLEACIRGPREGGVRAVKEIKKPIGNKQALCYSRELEATIKFSHRKYRDWFIRSFGWFETDSAVFIAMEYLPDRDLRRYLCGPFPEVEALGITHQLLEGLAYMHENEFVHRDMKPANILVVLPGPDWWVKIADFGISKRKDESTAFRTVIGTPEYLAPEVVDISTRASPTTDDVDVFYTFAVDMWALGQIAFQMITNRLAFASYWDLLKYAKHDAPFPAELLTSRSAGPECRDFVERVMAASAEKRLTSSEALSHPWMQSYENTTATDSIPQSNRSMNGKEAPVDEDPPSSIQTDVSTSSSVPSNAWSTILSIDHGVGVVPCARVLSPALATHVSVTNGNSNPRPRNEFERSLKVPTIRVHPPDGIRPEDVNRHHVSVTDADDHSHISKAAHQEPRSHLGEEGGELRSMPGPTGKESQRTRAGNAVSKSELELEVERAVPPKDNRSPYPLKAEKQERDTSFMEPPILQEPISKADDLWVHDAKLTSERYKAWNPPEFEPVEPKEVITCDDDSGFGEIAEARKTSIEKPMPEANKPTVADDTGAFLGTKKSEGTATTGALGTTEKNRIPESTGPKSGTSYFPPPSPIGRSLLVPLQQGTTLKSTRLELGTSYFPPPPPIRGPRVVPPQQGTNYETPLRGILKPPIPRFQENPNNMLGDVGATPRTYDPGPCIIPPGALWTKIKREFVSPEALAIGKERFEVRGDSVIVLRVLTREAIIAYARDTAILREGENAKRTPRNEVHFRRGELPRRRGGAGRGRFWIWAVNELLVAAVGERT